MTSPSAILRVPVENRPAVKVRSISHGEQASLHLQQTDSSRKDKGHANGVEETPLVTRDIAKTVTGEDRVT